MSSETCTDLAYDTYDGTDEMLPPLSPVVFVHGIFDTKSNWSEIAETVADRSVRKVYIIDLPNHGDSPESTAVTPFHFIEYIERFVNKIGEPIIFVAHSIGAISAMHIALNKPHLVKKLIVIDFSPIRYPSDTEIQIRAVLRIMQDVIKVIPSGLNFAEAKARVDKCLEKTLPIDAVRKIILPTLMQDDNGLRWKTRLDVIEKGSANTIFRQLYPFQGTYYGDTLIVTGELSNYVCKEDHEKIKKIFPNSTFKNIEKCDHWIHVEKKHDLINALLTFLSRSS